MKILILLTLLVNLVDDKPKLLKGIITDMQTGEAIKGVHIYSPESNEGAVSNHAGEFELFLMADEVILIISHIGYEHDYRTIEPGTEQVLKISLKPSIVQSLNTVYISSDKVMACCTGSHSHINTPTVDEYLKNLSGVDMINRANYAREPVIRGMQGNRVDVLIDGMRLTPACVDKMDPQTAYIETENLKSVSIQKSAGTGPATGTGGGSINFEMVKPQLNSGWANGLESSYQSVSNQRYLQGFTAYGAEKWALRVSSTFREAEDYKAGDQYKISNSGFRKNNVHTSLIYAAHPQHDLSLRYIGDFAVDIGYPGLIMDTRSANAHIAGLDHVWRIQGKYLYDLSSTVYYNQVDHWMDDYERDVTARNVMPNMNMPMYGQTQTYGVNSTARFFLDRNILSLTLESYAREAFAEMHMDPVDPSVSVMHLINLGDVLNWNTSLSTKYNSILAETWEMTLTGKTEAGINGLRHSGAKDIFRGQNPEINQVEPSNIAYQVEGILSKNFTSNLQMTMRISDGTRLPDHQEMYGYYIYQPLDNYFYLGNPLLKPERSTQAEIALTKAFSAVGLESSLALWINNLDHYITGIRLDDLFKQYKNSGSALLSGFEANINYRINTLFNFQNSLSYTLGQHLDFEEPLPMMPPLKGFHLINISFEKFTLNTEVRWAAAQNRIAHTSTIETTTGAYATWNISTDFQLSTWLNLRLGVENIFDHYYTEHLSVNKMPQPGRNIALSLGFRL
ncbi:MAG: TonB-dependent receptor [Balneolales bacterium]